MRHIEVGYELTFTGYYDVDIPDNVKDSDIYDYLRDKGKITEFVNDLKRSEEYDTHYSIDDLDTGKQIEPWE